VDTLTKKELVEAVARRLGVEVRHADEAVRPVLQAVLDEIIEQLAQGRRIEFRDFGVFEVRQRAARSAQNPKTLAPVLVPSRRAVKFKAGRLMKQRLDGGGGPQPGTSPSPGGPGEDQRRSA
jgi:integration host factor subunit beta